MLSPFPGMGVTVQQNVAAAQEQIQQQKVQAEQVTQQQKTAELTSKPVITWSDGGYGSGTYRNLYKDGIQYATIQIPREFAGRDEEYIQSQVSKQGYVTPSQVSPEIIQQRQIQATQAAEARHARALQHEQEQRDLLAGFQSRVASGEVRATEEAIAKVQAEGYDVSQAKSISQVGVEAAKVAEAKVAQEQKAFEQSLAGTTAQEAKAIENLLKSSTAEFASQEAAQKGYDLVGRFHLDFKAGDVRAHLKVEAPPVESPVGTTDISGMPKIPSIIHPAPSQEVTISGEVLQRMEDQRTQAKAEKWWNSLSNTEKASALVAAGTIDISVAGKYFGSKAAESRYINQQIKDIAFGSEKGKQYIIDAYKTLNIEGAKTQTPAQRFEEGLVKVGTGTSAQALATMVGFGAGTKIITGGAKAIGVSEAGVAAAEKLVGTGFKVAIGAELGGKVVEGKGGEAIAEAGLIATTLPFAAVGERAVAGVGKFTPTVKDFTKFTSEKVITPIKGTETFKFTAEKATPVTEKIPTLTGGRPVEVVVKGGLGIPVQAVEKIVEFPETARTKVTEKVVEPVRAKIEEKVTIPVEKLVEPFKERFVREPTIEKLMTPSIKTIYKSEKTSPEAKAMLESATRLEYLLKSSPPEQIVPIEFSKVKYGGKIGEIVKLRLETHKGDILAGSTSVGAFVPEFRGGKQPADFDYYAKDYKKTADYFLKEAKKVYPNAYKTENVRAKMFTIKDADGHSIMDIHPISEYTPIGERIVSGTGGVLPFKEIETLGKGVAPIVIEGAKVMAPKEQLTRKLHGTAKFIARKMVESPPHTLTGRGKDVPDFLDIAASLGRAEIKVKPYKAAKIEKEIEKFRKAEATKLYAKSPEAALVESGYALGKEFLKPEHKALPLFTNEKPIVEKSRYDIRRIEKSPLDYYPTEGKKVVDLTGGYYPPVKVVKTIPSGYYGGGGKGKPSGGYVPPEHKPKPDGGYYPPQRPTPRHPPIRREEPPIETKKSEEAAFVKGLEVRGEAKKAEKKETKGYVYKPRISPIFEGAEKLFEDNPVKIPKRVRKITSKQSSQIEFWRF